jgi:hypothetical protein
MKNPERELGVVDLVFSPLRSLFTLRLEGSSGLSDLCVALSPPSSAQPPESSRVARWAALVVEEAPAGDSGKRGGACLLQAGLLSSSPLCSMDALRPPMPVLPLSSDAHRATRRGFGWPPGSSDAYSELLLRQCFIERQPQRLKPC